MTIKFLQSSVCLEQYVSFLYWLYYTTSNTLLQLCIMLNYRDLSTTFECQAEHYKFCTALPYSFPLCSMDVSVSVSISLSLSLLALYTRRLNNDVLRRKRVFLLRRAFSKACVNTTIVWFMFMTMGCSSLAKLFSFKNMVVVWYDFRLQKINFTNMEVLRFKSRSASGHTTPINTISNGCADADLGNAIF